MELENHIWIRELLQWQKPEALNLPCMTVVLLICCHDNRHKMSISTLYVERMDSKIKLEGSRYGRKTVSLFLEENLCHYSVATGLWFTAAYSPYSSTGPWSPCRLNVEQHHDWDATSIHSPPLQQLWLTAQHTLFNPQKRAPRLSWKPVFLSECYWGTCCWWALINKRYLWNISDCRHCNWNCCTDCKGIKNVRLFSWLERMWTLGFSNKNVDSANTDRPPQRSNCLCCSCNELFKSIDISNGFQWA